MHQPKPTVEPRRNTAFSSRGSRLLERWRRAQGLSIKELARLINAPSSHGHCLCHGTAGPGLLLARRIRTLTGIPVASWCRDFPTKKATTIELAHKSGRRGYQRRQHSANGSMGYRVQTGQIPPADVLNCAFCGAPPDGSRRHWHHLQGYAFEKRRRVVPLCVRCHFGLHRGLLTPDWQKLRSMSVFVN